MKKFIENFFLKATTKLSIDLLMLTISFIFVLALKYDVNWNSYFTVQSFLPFILISFLVLVIRKTNYKSWVFLNTKDLFFTGIDIVLINIAYFSYTIIIPTGFPRHLIAGNLIIGLFLIFFPRFFLRALFLLENQKKTDGKNCLIIGAGTATDSLLREYNRNSKMDFRVVGLVDDNPKKKNTIMHNYRVLGNRYDIPDLIKENGVKIIIISIPSASGKDIKEIYSLANEDGVDVKILPNFSELLETKSMSSQIRDVEVEDLLGREPIEINNEKITSYIEGRIIFVTGGAGSIGSELCRQIANHNPSKIVCIDINENALYFLELEIKRNISNINIVSEICNIREKEKLEYLFNKYKPNLVYHAAAHKHVPLMENNPEEAIKNNIFGTKNMIDLAEKYHVERFVLISTDKAVNPTNIMGATKRVTEILLEAKAKKSNTKFMAVRFGNVLGSNGSVIPIFKKLISEKKNITLTHPEITRYFMTIPEASQLVLEAGSIGNGGEVFVLDMGQPVKIIDLAKNLIALSGLTLGVDIHIDVVGLRPGEKLYEELLYDVNSAEKTSNKKIFVTKLRHEGIKIEDFLIELQELIINKKFKNIKECLKKYVSTYKEADYN